MVIKSMFVIWGLLFLFTSEAFAANKSVAVVIKGLNGNLILRLNNTPPVLKTSKGAAVSFKFATLVAPKTRYTVATLAMPANQLCVVDKPTAVVGTSNISLVVNCTNTRLIGGKVTGLKGILKLQLQQDVTNKVISEAFVIKAWS